MVLAKIKKFWQLGSGRTALAAVCAHSVSISIGICQGYSAILIPQLIKDDNFHINAEECSWLASLGAITNPLGSILSGILAEYFGRKRSIQLSSFPFIIGWILIGFAKDIKWLYAGRLISGIAAGMSTACYTYVSELSTPENRGFFQTLGPICASFGILLTYSLGYFILWSTVAKISLFFAFFSLITMQFLPESPAFLLKKQKMNEAFNIYLWFKQNNALAQQEIEKHSQKLKEKDNEHNSGNYLCPQTIKPFFILVILFLLQELSGIYIILFYSVSFFQEIEFNIDEYISSIIVGAIRFIMSIIAAILINKFGRKILCISSAFGMTITMLTVAAYVKFYEVFPYEKKLYTYIPLIGIVLNVLFSMVGMLPIPWILIGELFPLEVRSIMGGIVSCIAQCFIFICVKMYHDMLSVLSFGGMLFVFVVASTGALLFSKFVLPETKNKSLYEIEEYFKGIDNKSKLHGFDNKAFILKPEVDVRVKKKNNNKSEIFRIEIENTS